MSVFSAQNRKTIKGQAQLGGIYIAALVSFMILTSLVGGSFIHTLNARQAETANRGVDVIGPLAELSIEIQLDIVQVQQWLTDISATRGRDGLNDGFDQAKLYAGKFTKDIDRAMALARRLDNANLVSILGNAQKSFAPYYAAGQTMAHAYVNKGPDGGNALMANFDAAAEKLNAHAAEIKSETHKLYETMKIDVHAVESQSANAIIAVILAVIVVAVASLVFSLYQMRANIKAADVIALAAQSLQKASNGQLNTRVVGIDRKDEIGDLVLGTNRLLDLMEAFLKDAGASMEYAGRRQYFRKIMARGLRGRFVEYAGRINGVIDAMADRRKAAIAFGDEKVAPAIEFLVNEADSLSEHAKRMAFVASSTIDQARVVAETSENATANVETVAAAAEELSASISEINRQTDDATRIAGEAAREIESVNATVTELNEASQKIGSVVELILEVAEKTNLLALNATIEAARAGEAGKGFAVVAGEVKNLSNQTSKATEEITAQINGMRAITANTVERIQSIGETIGHMNENVHTVTGAVREQKAATNEISRSVHDAATGTRDVSTRVGQVAADAEETNKGAEHLLDASMLLKSEADTLKKSLQDFLGTMV